MASQRNKPGRDEKFTIPLDSIADMIPELLESIQVEMFNEAVRKRDARTWSIDSLDEFRSAIVEKPGFYSVWWDGNTEDEARLQQETKATVRCIPLEQPEGSGECILTGRKTSTKVILARAY